MVCKMGMDFPLRVRTPSSKVIHAAARVTIPKHTKHSWGGPSKVVPAKDIVVRACRYSHDYNGRGSKHILPNSELMVDNAKSITCKSCLTSMGIIVPELEQVLYVIRHKESGEYRGHRCSYPELMRARMYKVKKAAIRSIRRYEYFIKGKQVKAWEYRAAVRAGELDAKKEIKFDDRYEIIPVKIIPGKPLSEEELIQEL